MSETKIAAKPEGRDGVWLADRASLKAFITAKDFDAIHNFAAAGSLLIGADHDVASVLEDIDQAARVAVLTGESQRQNRYHALALIMPPSDLFPERLEMYDIGEITDEDIEAEP